ncbi:MAG: hypothetical protein F7B20_02210 [Aeropyrum sp.]|nr:hypothetical protein [Aeropyrum sp.]MCE4615828.1 hypothetical protein [Aeropyrum sp.]
MSAGNSTSSIEAILVEERLIGYLDPGAEEVLLKLNKPAKLETTSSCMGRVSIVEGEWHWMRDEARIVYKTHDTLTLDEVERVLSRPFTDLWLKASGPIIHLKSSSIECAHSLIQLARIHGFKHSGIISAQRGGHAVVELMSSLEMSLPLRVRNRDIIREESLVEVVELANRIVNLGRRRLYSLAEVVSSLQECF